MSFAALARVMLAILVLPMAARAQSEPVALPEPLAEEAERLEPLTGVKAYPARVKCATLSWHALEAALKGGGAGTMVKTE